MYKSFHVNQTRSTWVNVGGCCLAAYRPTKKGRGGDGPVAPGHHDTDPRLNEGYGKVYDLWPLLVDGEWSHCHVGVLQHHLQDKHRETETDSSANACLCHPEDGKERSTTVLQFISMLWSFQVFKMLFLEETRGLLLHCVCVRPPPTSFPPSVFSIWCLGPWIKVEHKSGIRMFGWVSTNPSHIFFSSSWFTEVCYPPVLSLFPASVVMFPLS